MAKRLFLCRIEHEFVVCAGDQDDANDIAEEARIEEVDVMQARVVREITSVTELGNRKNEYPYGEDLLTCAEILETDDAGGA